MALIIGSVAMNTAIMTSGRCIRPNMRKPKDLDMFARPDDPAITEWSSSGEKVEPFWHDSFTGTQLDREGIATLDELYTIKHSHVYWELKNGSWDKHMLDLMTLRSLGAKLDMDLHKLLYPVWVETHGAKKMNLDQGSDNFFKDAVVRIYDHDSIHDSCCFGNYPLYEDILKEGATVDIDANKLWSMDYETLVLLFREEIAATALERWMIPANYRFSPGLAYKLALRKTIVSLTKGRSARFIVSNFEDFYRPHDYMGLHIAKKDRLIPLDRKAMQKM
jgi:hypothetical protein